MSHWDGCAICALFGIGAWLNPGNILQVASAGRAFVEMALNNAPKFLAMLVIVHVLAFFLLLYGARLLKKLIDMVPGVSKKQNVVEIASEIEQTAAASDHRTVGARQSKDCVNLVRFLVRSGERLASLVIITLTFAPRGDLNS